LDNKGVVCDHNYISVEMTRTWCVVANNVISQEENFNLTLLYIHKRNLRCWQ